MKTYFPSNLDFNAKIVHEMGLCLPVVQGVQWASAISHSEEGPGSPHMWVLGSCKYTQVQVFGLVQERHNSSALAMELRLSCTLVD